MTLNYEDIYNKLRYLDAQYTGNVVEEIITYSVKNKQVSLFIEKSPSGANRRYKVKFYDWASEETSETNILFEAYPKKRVGHSVFIRNNGNRVYYSNSGIQKNFREILKAIGKLHNLPICGRNGM